MMFAVTSVSHRFRVWSKSILALLAISATATTGAARGDNVIFTIDPNQSYDTWSGSDNSYGAFQAQSSGSLTTAVSGNFIVNFDPTTDTPQSIQLVGNNANNNNGFYQLATNPASFQPFGTPANLAGTTSGGQLEWAIRDLVYNYNSAPIAATGSSGTTTTYSATTTNFAVTSGGIDYKTTTGEGPQSYVGSTDHLTTGTWTLTESAPGSGQWTLTLSGTYNYTYNTGTTRGTFTAAGVAVATANYAVGGPNANVATVSSSGGSVDALGGAGKVGGVTATFDQNQSGGTVSVQQVPGITSLTQAAVTAGQNNPVFALSTSDVSIGAPQIWNVEFTGNLNGGTATLIFDYDPSLLPAGTDQSRLGIWHFDKTTNQWVFGGTVDVPDHTITFETSSFSPFELGLSPTPEPATLILAATGLLPLAIIRARRRRSAASDAE